MREIRVRKGRQFLAGKPGASERLRRAPVQCCLPADRIRNIARCVYENSVFYAHAFPHEWRQSGSTNRAQAAFLCRYGPKVGWFLSVLNKDFVVKRLEEAAK